MTFRADGSERPGRRIAPPLLLVAAIAGVLGCRGGTAPLRAPRDAREAAIELFALARLPDPSPSDVALVLDPDRAAGDPAGCRAALAALASVSSTAVAGIEPLVGMGKTAVDVDASLPGGGVARFAVQAAPRPDGTWRVVSFEGAGAAWPPARAPRDEGLTTSAPS